MYTLHRIKNNHMTEKTNQYQVFASCASKEFCLSMQVDDISRWCRNRPRTNHICT